MTRKDKRSLGKLTLLLLGTFFVLLLSILLPKVNLSSRKSQAASLLDFPCQYSIKVAQTSNPTLFAFQLPWETKTPADMSGIVAGNLSDFKSGNIKALKVIPGPFKWVPDIDKDWDYAYDFGSVPEVITIGHAAYVKLENGKEINEFRYACSVWQKPTTPTSPCPPSLAGPADGVEIYGSYPLLIWGGCNLVRGQQAIQLNIVGGTSHPINFTSDPLITTNFLVDPQYIPLDPGARYSWKIRVCNIDASQKCVSSASPWSFPWTFYWQTRTKSPAITRCPTTVSISRNQSNPASFDFYVPSSSVRSDLIRMDGVMAAKLDGNIQVVPGPLPWTSVTTPTNMSKYSKTFQFIPEFVAGGLVTYNGFNNQINYGCGYLKLTPTPTSTPTPTPKPISTPVPTASCRVTLYPLTIYGSIGQNVNLSAQVTNLAGGTIGRVEFTSANSSIASISPTNDYTLPYTSVLTPRKPGTTTATAKVFLTGRTIPTCSDSSVVSISSTQPLPTIQPTITQQ